MANLAETSNFDAGVYQLEITDPVEGGAGGISNAQAQALANRTLWLKDRGDDLETFIDQVADDLQDEVDARILADALIYTYLPKKRGSFTGLDVAGQTVGDTLTCSGNFTSATVTQDGTTVTVIRVVMSGAALPNSNYRVAVDLQSVGSGDMGDDANVYAPVFRPINSTTFDLAFKEAGTALQNLKVHLQVFDLNF